MKMIPKTPSVIAPSSERKVFQLLQGLPSWDEWVALYSLRLDWHLTQIEGEIDFLLIGPAGVFVVEVKGGRIEFDGNIWTSTDKEGEVYVLKRPPMRQASDAMWSLKTKLCGQDFPVVRSTARSARWGWLVIFTDSSVNAPSVEWHPDKIICSNSLSSIDSFSAALHKAVEYHIRQDPQRNELTKEEILSLSQSCRPIFDTVPSLKQEILHLDEVAMALTNDQYKVLDWALDNPRIICIGGAGTGKTLVALELARRRRDEGSLVIFTCGSRPLLDLLERQPRVSGINFVEWRHATSLSKVDFLVVDEAQDLLGPEFELVASSILRSGLIHGKWFISLDPNRQSGLVKPFDEEFYEILKSYSTVMRLNKNVRNTLTIMEQTRWATKADLGVDGTGTGPQVNWVASTNESTEGDLVAREVRRLIDDESLDPSEIAILCVNPAAKPSFSESALRELGVPLLNLGSASHRLGVVFASVSEFKGMERQAILIVGARNLDQIANPLNHLYTGMSRARGFLWIATTLELANLIEEQESRSLS
jgi:hypothetical protein